MFQELFKCQTFVAMKLGHGLNHFYLCQVEYVTEWCGTYSWRLLDLLWFGLYLICSSQCQFNLPKVAPKAVQCTALSKQASKQGLLTHLKSENMLGSDLS